MTSRLPGVLVGLALAAVLYFPGLGALPFYNKGEPREVLSLVAQTEARDWILPLTDGTTVPSKPPLLRWLGGVAVAATGRLDEWAARLPSAALATVTVVAVAAAGAAGFGTAGGVAAAVALATTWSWALAAREARADMPLAACLTLALLALERACRVPIPSLGAVLALYASAALAVLAKGPVGIAIPAVVGLVYLALRRDLGRLRRMRLGLGVLIVGALAGTWYALAAAQGGEAFVARQLGHENVARFLGGAEHTSHAKPFYYYGPAFLVGCLPWTLLLVPLAAYLWSLRGRLETAGVLFPLVWAGAVVGFYSLAAGKRALYLLPAYPAVALLLGAWCASPSEGRAALARTRPAVQAIVWTLLLVAGGAIAAVLLGGADAGGATAWLHPKDRRTLGLMIELGRAHIVAAAGVVLMLGGALGVVLAGLRRTSPPLVVAGMGAFAVAVALAANAAVHPALARGRTLREFAAVVAARVPSDAELRFVGPPNGSLRFYLGRPAPPARRPVFVADDAERCRYLLVWKTRWRRMRPETRAALALVAKSAGSGPEGNDRLLLVRARSAACAAAATAGPVARRGRPCEHRPHGVDVYHFG